MRSLLDMFICALAAILGLQAPVSGMAEARFYVVALLSFMVGLFCFLSGLPVLGFLIVGLGIVLAVLFARSAVKVESKYLSFQQAWGEMLNWRWRRKHKRQENDAHLPDYDKKS